MKFLRFVILLSTMFLASCASTLHKGPMFSTMSTPNDGKALVYFYRPNSPPLWRSPDLLIEKKKIAVLYNKGYTYLYVSPGEYTVETDWAWDAGVPDLKGRIMVEANKTYYVRLGGGMRFSGSIVSTSTSLGAVSNNIAVQEISECMLIDPLIKELKK